MDCYMSINGFQVMTSTQIVPVDICIKDVFTDSITREIFEKPAYIAESHMIYDFQSIRQWLLSSDVDPLTGIALNKNQIEVIPVLNYFLAMLCLEEKNSEMYYHVPIGNMFDLLKIALHVYENHESKKFKKIVCLDTAKYFDSFEIEDGYLKSKLTYASGMYQIKTIYEPIKIEDLLLKCPISGRYFDKTCIISDFGIFIHPSIGNPKLTCIRGNTLANHIINCKSKANQSVNISGLNEIFIDAKSVKPQFTILQSYPSHDRLVDTHKTVDQLDEIDLNAIAYLVIYDLNELFDISKILTPGYMLTAVSVSEKIYQFYLDHRDRIDPSSKSLLSMILNNSDITKFGSEFVQKRNFFGFPTICSGQHMIYGNDYSFLEIRKKMVAGGYLKQTCFVGTQFTNSIFINSQFCECVFIGADFAGFTAIGCVFNRCSFYKTAKPINVMNCTFNNCT